MRIALIDDSSNAGWVDGGHMFAPLAAPLRARGCDVVILDAARCGPDRMLTGLSRERDAQPLLASARIAAHLMETAVDACFFPARDGLAHSTLMARSCGEIPPATRVFLWDEPQPPNECVATNWSKDGLREVVSAALRRFSDGAADTILDSVALSQEPIGDPRLNFSFAPTLMLWPVADPIREFVFCGRLNRSAGLVSFVEAMEALGRRGDLGGRSVSFVGFFDETHGGVDREWLGRRAAAWPFRFSVRETRSLADATKLATGVGRATLAADVGVDLVTRLSPAARARLRIGFVSNDIRFQASRLLGTFVDGPPTIYIDQTDRVAAAVHELSSASTKVVARGSEGVGFSVCILHHERPELLKQALDSVLDQADDRIPLEILVTDNASRSSQAREALSAAAKRTHVKILNLDPPLPYSSALNAAAEVATQPFLIFLDDDNLLAPGGLAALARACGSGAFEVITSTLELFDDAPSETVGLMTFIGPAQTAGLFFNAFGDNCMAFNRERFLQIGGYLQREGPYPCADWILLCRAQAAGLRIGVLQRPAFRYRRGLSKSGAHWQPWDQQAVRAMLLEHYGDGFDAKELARAAQAMAAALI